MKNIVLSAFVCLLFSISTTAYSQTEAQMKAWQEYMTPGEMHKLLANFEGDWTTEGKMWMEPNAQPATSKGECNYRMILGGRYQESEFKGDFMGQPFEGKGLTSYDNLKKQFEGSWIDNMGTGVMRTSGTYDPATKTFSFTGQVMDPMTGKECKMRETLKVVDNDTHVMTMYSTYAGQPEFKSMEMTFKRKK